MPASRRYSESNICDANVFVMKAPGFRAMLLVGIVAIFLMGCTAPPEPVNEAKKPAPAEQTEPQEPIELATYHHAGLGIWFDYPATWSIEPFPSPAAAESRGFKTETADCRNQKPIDPIPVRVLDESGSEVAALGMPASWASCVNVPVESTVEFIDRQPVSLSGAAPVSFVYLTTEDGEGGRFPVMGLTDEMHLMETESMSHGMVFWAQSDDPDSRHPVSFSSTTSFSVTENSTRSGSSLTAFDTQDAAEAFTKSEQYENLKLMYLSTRYQEDPSTPNGDLGLTEPISTPRCDGSQIAVLGTSWTPDLYQEEIQRYLDAFPGSHYSRTDLLCTSFLRPALDNSGENYIYFVYQEMGDDTAATCNAVQAAKAFGGNTHGKWLRNGTPGEQIPC
jgi:hypothetical protein